MIGQTRPHNLEEKLFLNSIGKAMKLIFERV
jgi:hypothetical protein